MVVNTPSRCAPSTGSFTPNAMPAPSPFRRSSTCEKQRQGTASRALATVAGCPDRARAQGRKAIAAAAPHRHSKRRIGRSGPQRRAVACSPGQRAPRAASGRQSGKDNTGLRGRRKRPPEPESLTQQGGRTHQGERGRGSQCGEASREADRQLRSREIRLAPDGCVCVRQGGRRLQRLGRTSGRSLRRNCRGGAVSAPNQLRGETHHGGAQPARASRTREPAVR
jgi:hypothetical protein